MGNILTNIYNNFYLYLPLFPIFFNFLHFYFFIFSLTFHLITKPIPFSFVLSSNYPILIPFISSLIKQKLLLIILFLPFNFLPFFSFLSFHFLLPCYKTQFLIFFVQFLLVFQKFFYKLI